MKITEALFDLYNKHVEHEKRMLILEQKVDSLEKSVVATLEILSGK